MEYGASAEDIARVCHAHPVSWHDDFIGVRGGVGGREGGETESNRVTVKVRSFLPFRLAQRL